MTPPDVCIPNIGHTGRRARGVSGMAFLLASLGWAVWVGVTDASVLARVAVFIPALIGAMGLVQAREKT